MGRCCLLLLAMAACKSSPEMPVDADSCPLPTFIDECMQYAETYCGRLQVCSDSRFRTTWTDLETCTQRNALACTLELSSPTTGATTATVAACTNALAGQPCDAFLSGYQPPTECLPPAGTIADGDACGFSSQCASAFCGLDGKCHAEPKVGDSCYQIGCGPTLVCSGGLVGHETCMAPVGEGVHCMSNGEPIAVCAYGITCVAAPPTLHEGYCAKQATQPGATCEPNASEGCNSDLGLSCYMGKCAQTTFLPVNSPCEDARRWERCDSGTTCVLGTCTAPVADCFECQITGEGPDLCEYPARCDGTCTLPR